MLGKVFARFVEKSPISVMVRGTLERVLGADQLDAWFARTAQKQYTRTVLFSTVYDVLSQGVFRIKPLVRAAYRDQEDKVGASLISLSNKLNGVETHTSAEMARRRRLDSSDGHFQIFLKRCYPISRPCRSLGDENTR